MGKGAYLKVLKQNVCNVNLGWILGAGGSVDIEVAAVKEGCVLVVCATVVSLAHHEVSIILDHNTN